MSFFDEEPEKAAPQHVLGQDLSMLSVSDIDERIGQLRDEIARLETERAAKGVTKDAAEAFFRRE